jgi:hypothetical protein
MFGAVIKNNGGSAACHGASGKYFICALLIANICLFLRVCTPRAAATVLVSGCALRRFGILDFSGELAAAALCFPPQPLFVLKICPAMVTLRCGVSRRHDEACLFTS